MSPRRRQDHRAEDFSDTISLALRRLHLAAAASLTSSGSFPALFAFPPTSSTITSTSLSFRSNKCQIKQPAQVSIPSGLSERQGPSLQWSSDGRFCTRGAFAGLYSLLQSLLRRVVCRCRDHGLASFIRQGLKASTASSLVTHLHRGCNIAWHLWSQQYAHSPIMVVTATSPSFRQLPALAVFQRRWPPPQQASQRSSM